MTKSTNNKKYHHNKQKQESKEEKVKSKICSSENNVTDTNRPRNHLVLDATSPYTFSYMRYGKCHNITVNQTPEEETWPGGALWDIGLLLAKILVMINTPKPPISSSLPYISRLMQPGIWPTSWKNCVVLELGCGVGLTGLVAASLGAKLTLLTDLDIVVDKVTRPNVDLNKHLFGIGQKVLPVSLCWGCEQDEIECKRILSSHKSTPNNTTKCKIKKISLDDDDDSSLSSKLSYAPDVILIGDVAYQHKPGAPSHFDVLLSTLLKFVNNKTTIIFGTRMRMPASMDLLDLFREHFTEVIEPVEAYEIDHAFKTEQLGRKSLITIHVFKNK